jgi:hypothetical protein
MDLMMGSDPVPEWGLTPFLEAAMRLALSLVVLASVLATLPFASAQDAASRGAAADTSPSREARRAADDPRVCLDFPTNLQVIACAEKYRPPRRRA